ncbi:hypothetical protein ABFX02_12G002500 [Erythranthe guttata]
MATGKGRGMKRSTTGSCYSSTTTTTIIFISLSALFLWLFTTTNNSSSTNINNISSISRSDENDDQPSATTIATHDLHLEPEQILPVDPVKSTDHDNQQPTHDNIIQVNQNDDDPNDASSSSSSNNISEDDTSSTTQVQVEQEEEKVTLNNNEPQAKESLEEEEKQAALETQTSEESTVTHKQEIQQTKQDINNHFHDDDHATTSSSSETTTTISHNNDHEIITDEDGQQRLEEHQKQEDDQFQQIQQKWHPKNDPTGATSHDQIQHDEQEPITLHHEQIINHDDDDQVKKTTNSNNNNHNHNNNQASSKDDQTKNKKKSSTQADDESTVSSEKERRNNGGGSNKDEEDKSSSSEDYGYKWQMCNTSAGADYIPCLDNEKVISQIHTRKHHEHRERHCPEDPPTCLVPLPNGYKRRIDWPQSRDKIWYHNVPHTLLAEVKGHQNWVKVVGEFLTFPGGGTQFIHGALHYIDFIQEAVPDIAWGKHSRVVLDVGCGVASLGGYLFERDVLTMSFAPKDEHEAQVQFALERGIPAISAVMGSQRLPFPSRVFDVVHCARCRVPWHADGGALLLELNRVLRPGGYFVWSATPVYQKLEEDVQIWREMSNLTVAMCWELITIKKDKLNSVGVAIYRKPDSNDCYEQRKRNSPPMCKLADDPNAAWYVPLQSCMHKTPVGENERGSQWPEEWPERIETPPYWLNNSEMGIHGKPSPDDFTSDYQHWKKVVQKSYMDGLGINWSNVRNVMDMKAVYGGFAAALKEMKVWVMNVVNIDSPDTLPIIYERGLFGIYHDWCESFSTYPRTYDLLHADHLFSGLKKRCKVVTVVAEVDRIVRPGGKLIVRDDSKTIGEIDKMLKSLQWKVSMNLSENEQHVVLTAHKSQTWRPDSYAPPS